ncbi:serine/threonine-protein kinase [Neorhodopirellula pilleata]|uniref:Serine/threonine-protein kinase PrkC n=1 Tax=Neorhodopirellula pilleata TaxID=2714738 RepID=A0A5C5ZXM4_9BACT|nr:serine/threonine-protein kinase [Neorhodopirellula pilleata]TWT91910.1 Serine/threonine-protein kinase PrkC [Neorhodopirellula pilleata]
MAFIRVVENGVHRLDRAVPDEFQELGCVFYLEESFVATLSVGGSVECGNFTVSFLKNDPANTKLTQESNPTSADSDVPRSVRVYEETDDLQTKDPLMGDPETIMAGTHCASEMADDHSSYPQIRLEVLPRIPGYDLQSRIGRGGMGYVWKAMQLSTHRMVALKTIHPRRLGNVRNQKRFQREVELAARLIHPNIVRVYDAGKIAGQHYYSMDLVEGVPWSQYVRKQRPDRAKVLQQLIEVLDAIAYAHSQGIVHRDLKPSNILIDKHGKACVVDFGLAKHRDLESEGLSEQGDVIGTLNFMSPEQASGNVALTDSRSDVYSLGAVLVYLLGNGLSVAKLGERQDYIRLLSEGALQKQALELLEMDPALREILMKALAPQPSQRYQDADAFASDLKHYLADVVSSDSKAASIAGTETRSSTASTTKAALYLFGLVFTVASVGFVIWWFAPKNAPAFSALDSGQMSGISIPDDPSVSMTPLQKLESQFEASFTCDGELSSEAETTAGVGNEDPANFSIVHPKRWPLVGVNLSTYLFKSKLIIKTIQPIFRDPVSGRTETSQMLGRLNPDCRFEQVIAKSGYYVSGLTAVGGRRVHSLKLIFHRDESIPSPETGVATLSPVSTKAVMDDGDTGRRYESPWYGQETGENTLNSEIKIGDSESTAIGIRCSYEVDLHQIALIFPPDQD